MIRYYVNDVEVERQDALWAWVRSRTYRMAKFKDAIWPNAEKGSMSPDVVNHLREAGVRIERDDLSPNYS